MPAPHSRAPAYRIETPRLVVRCWEPRDAPLMKSAIDASLDHLRPWMPWANQHPAPIEKHVERCRSNRGNFDLGHDFVFAVFDRDEKNVLGGTGLHTRLGDGAREIGYWVHVDHIGRGIATELSAALTKVGFLVEGLERIEIHCDPANARSASVPRKLGYTLDATLRRRSQTTDGKPRDTMVWSMLHDEFGASPAAKLEIAAFDSRGDAIEV